MSNGNYQRPAGKEDVPNKISFSSVKLGNTKQGSPTLGLYLKRDQLEKLVALGTELLAAGEDGCKIGCIVIQGKDYDSGYAYVNPKEARQGGDQAQGQNQGQSRGFQGGGSNGGSSYRKQNAGPANRDEARSWLASKKLAGGEQKS